MRAVQVTRFGPPSVLVATELGVPAPGPGQVLIRVEAAGVNFIDTMLRADNGPLPAPQPPFVPGNEVGGTVVEVGANSNSFAGAADLAGRTVVAGLGGFGGYAELAVAPAGLVVPVPDRVPVRNAVALMASGRTAVELIRRAGITGGERVLVLAAAGGLGSLLVQLARAAGAGQVIGAARGKRKLELVSEVGADAAVDYEPADWTEAVLDATDGAGADVVFDGVGGPIGRAGFELLADGTGRQVVYGYASGTPVHIEAAELIGRGLSLVSVGGPRLRDPAYAGELVREALSAAADGHLRPTIGQTFPLEAAAAAHAAIEARRAIGKTLLIP